MSGGEAGGLSWSSAFCEHKLWIDLVVFGLLGFIHAMANFRSPNLGSEDTDRERSFSYAKELLTGGLATAGVLLPLSLTAFGTLQVKSAPNSALVNIFLADAWLSLSLIIGLGTLWTAGYRAHTENVQNLRDVRIGPGLQVLALGIGVVRLLIAAKDFVV